MANEVAKRLRDRRLNVWEQAKELADKAAEDNRAFSAEEQGTWDALNEELDKLDTRIKAVLEQEDRAKAADEQFNRIHGQTPETGKAPESKRTGELRAFLRGDQGAPRFFDVVPEGPVEQRVLSKLTAGAGGNVVPTSFYDRLMAHLIETAGIMRVGPTVLNTTSGEVVQVPKTTAHSSAAIVAEAAAIGASDPVFGQISLGAFKYGILVQVSRELVTDEGVDLEGYLAMQTGRALGNAFGAHAITGTGTGQPRGVVTDATTGVTGPVGTSTSFGVQSTADMGGDCFINLFYSVIEPYRMSSSCAWLVRDATAGAARKIKSSQGEYIWQPSLIPGTPDTILGKPVASDPTVAAVGVSAKSVVFGDFSQYFVRIAGGVRFERSDDFAFNTDLITYRALLRADGALVDLTGAVKVFIHSAT
jgi:HK97 family phage major capsid protein